MDMKVYVALFLMMPFIAKPKKFPILHGILKAKYEQLIGFYTHFYMFLVCNTDVHTSNQAPQVYCPDENEERYWEKMLLIRETNKIYAKTQKSVHCTMGTVFFFQQLFLTVHKGIAVIFFHQCYC